MPTCSEEIDSVWGIQWHAIKASETATSSCGSGVLGQYLHIHFAMVVLFMHIGLFPGNATRYCDLSGQWENPQVEDCETSQFGSLSHTVSIATDLLRSTPL